MDRFGKLMLISVRYSLFDIWKSSSYFMFYRGFLSEKQSALTSHPKEDNKRSYLELWGNHDSSKWCDSSKIKTITTFSVVAVLSMMGAYGHESLQLEKRGRRLALKTHVAKWQFVTWSTSQPLRSWLNELASSKILSIAVTRLTSQSPTSLTIPRESRPRASAVI